MSYIESPVPPVNITKQYESGAKIYLTDMKLNGVKFSNGGPHLTILPNSGFNIFVVERISEGSLRLKSNETTWGNNSYVGHSGRSIVGNANINNSIHFEIDQDQFGITLRESGNKTVSVTNERYEYLRRWDSNYPHVLLKVHRHPGENAWQHLGSNDGSNGGGDDDFAS